jgi:hypothetical protein
VLCPVAAAYRVRYGGAIKVNGIHRSGNPCELHEIKIFRREDSSKRLTNLLHILW